jgi:hypothetical protein
MKRASAELWEDRNVIRHFQQEQSLRRGRRLTLGIILSRSEGENKELTFALIPLKIAGIG